jgi:hypothetical protein
MNKKIKLAGKHRDNQHLLSTQDECEIFYRHIKKNNVTIIEDLTSTQDSKFFHCPDLYGNRVIIVELISSFPGRTFGADRGQLLTIIEDLTSTPYSKFFHCPDLYGNRVTIVELISSFPGLTFGADRGADRGQLFSPGIS